MTLFQQALILDPDNTRAKELLGVSAQVHELETLMRGARDLMALDDHSGALALLNRVLQVFPNHPEALKLQAQSELRLLAQYESRIGRIDQKPRVLLQSEEIIWLNLDHRAGFLLSLMDGQVSFEDVYNLSGMSRLDTSRVLAQLLEQEIIRAG